MCFAMTVFMISPLCVCFCLSHLLGADLQKKFSLMFLYFAISSFDCYAQSRNDHLICMRESKYKHVRV